MYLLKTRQRTTIALLSVLLLTAACKTKNKPDTHKQTDTTSTHTPITLTSEQRRNNTTNFLKQKGITTLASLPLTEAYPTARFRNTTEVAEKAVVLYALIAVAQKEITAADAIVYFKKYDLWKNVSALERSYLAKHPKTEDDNAPVNWRIENLHVLLWALGYINTLDFPTAECDMNSWPEDLPDTATDPRAWISKSRLRDTEDILTETDLIYNIHWATTDATLNNYTIPARLNPDVVMERHFALNWLTMYADNWDDITTDT